MKNGIFGKWFREFATLVLTQTVQAFLLAVVMSIIISCLNNNTSGVPDGDANNAAGLLAIVALASFNKIELLVKNIFGVTSQFGPSLDNGARGLAGTAMAFRGLKNISDNIGKAREGSRLRKQGEAGLRAMNAGNGTGEDGTNPLNKDLLNNPNGDKKDDENDDTTTQQTEHQIEDQVIKLQTMGDIAQLTDAIKELNKTTAQSNKTDTQSKMKEYQDMINQGRNMQKTALHESVGATIGAGAGAIYGLAKGDDVAKTALAGAGFGDDAGKYIASSKANKQAYNKKMEELSKMGETNYNNAQAQIDNFMKQAAENVSSGKVDNPAAYNRMVVDAVKSYKNNISKNMSSSVSNAKKVSPSSKDSMKKLKDIQNKLDKNIDIGKQ